MAQTAPPPLDKVDPRQAWQPWQPTDKDPWDAKWAAHLYRRAVFGASPAEVKETVKRGLKDTLDLLMTGEPRAAQLGDFLDKEGAKIAKRNNQTELRGWWLYCMLQSGYPLREKMTLFWHNHFATSITKVNKTTLMAEQNSLLRRHALGKFGPFLLDMSKNPAMLQWLDSNSNVKAAPNENYAREVMELFSLGVGNYKEKDIQEAARAFTGWHTNDDKYEFNPALHDDGEKTVLGQTGKWNGEDVVRILLEQKACALFLTRKLYRFYVSETREPPDAFLEPLAEQLRKSDYDVAALVRTMLASRHFYSAHAFRQRIKSPVEFVLGAAKTVVDGTINQQALVGRLDGLGQALFAPPNVKGWPGGQSWLNTSTILARQNFAQVLAMGTLWKEVPRSSGNRFQDMIEEERRLAEELAEEARQQAELGSGKKPPAPKATPEEPAPSANLDPARLVTAAKVEKPEDVARVLLDAFLPGGVRPQTQKKVTDFLADGKPTGPALARRVREAVHAIVCMPEYQLA